MNLSRIKIYGAGSIGNHLANAARTLGMSVCVVDRDREALRRMREDIYPSRYGRWDDGITLHTSEDEPEGGFDLICVGTPPAAHVPLALKALKEKPKAIQVEKPLCMPDMASAAELRRLANDNGVKVFVGYDHVVGKSARQAVEMVKEGVIGDVLTLDVEFREFWGGIFAAHPWLAGPHDSYLGFWKQGGGASGEHSHALNLWQHLARSFDFGRVTQVDALMRYVTNERVDYDELCSLHLITDKGFCGRVIQDVVTQPVRKVAIIQGSKGTLTNHVNHSKAGDALILHLTGKDPVITTVAKARPDDFIEELKHIDASLNAAAPVSPLDLDFGLDTMMVVAAAHRSHATGRRMVLPTPPDYSLESLRFV
ncbi:Gfo/Idh/MocA family oxidoreductase [Prosthecobacter sp.]|uniref:Gfo/Idh/MocA family protein n=1 Tax=Prosthecobacter sp. TaxID=1965333 RepID=UPI002AB850AD|nr:Gfo/Idh/MocA family oxidoreductase [Prosthecobacter sp.]MDZ4405792.1 Gfo/Idh/MocA family oxidoreductase [Prosthecobacter sp.]